MIRLDRIGNAIAAAIEDRGVRGVGELVNTPKSNIDRWAGDPHRWSLAAGLALAAELPAVREALLDAIDGVAPVGHGADLTRDAHAVNVGGNRTLATVAEHLADGTYSPAEARADLSTLRAFAAQVRRLILDAESVAAAGGAIGRRS